MYDMEIGTDFHNRTIKFNVNQIFDFFDSHLSKYNLDIVIPNSQIPTICCWLARNCELSLVKVIPFYWIENACKNNPLTSHLIIATFS